MMALLCTCNCWLSAELAGVEFLRKLEPFIHLTRFDHCQILSQIHPILFQIIFQKLLEYLAVSVLVIWTFMTEFISLPVQAFDEFAIRSPSIRSESTTPLASDLLHWNFIALSNTPSPLRVIPFRPVYRASPTIKPTPADEFCVSHIIFLNSLKFEFHIVHCK